MPSRDGLIRELERIRAHWPSMAGTETALKGYVEILHGFTDEEVHGGVTIVLQEYEGAAAPKPKHLRDACGRVAKVRRDVPNIVSNEDAYCPLCGTTQLMTNRHGRMVPLHRAGCVREDAETYHPPQGPRPKQETESAPTSLRLLVPSYSPGDAND
jgi:hypothetical protein